MHRFSLGRLGGYPDHSLQDKPVYLTLDLDVLDPGVLPGTGTPEPGGVLFAELLSAVLQLHQVQLVGCDIVELARIMTPAARPPPRPASWYARSSCK